MLAGVMEPGSQLRARAMLARPDDLLLVPAREKQSDKNAGDSCRNFHRRQFHCWDRYLQKKPQIVGLRASEDVGCVSCPGFISHLSLQASSGRVEDRVHYRLAPPVAGTHYEVELVSATPVACPEVVPGTPRNPPYPPSQGQIAAITPQLALHLTRQEAGVVFGCPSHDVEQRCPNHDAPSARHPVDFFSSHHQILVFRLFHSNNPQLSVPGHFSETTATSSSSPRSASVAPNPEIPLQSPRFPISPQQTRFPSSDFRLRSAPDKDRKTGAGFCPSIGSSI
ncbi:hypothetical protein G7046_g5699 [Stylonectria norvegica]|nr:hypothetical protein G7046_g5699 [Stylonectria norvegica]